MNVDITPTAGFPHMYDFIGDSVGKGSSPVVLIVLTIVIIFYYILFSYLGISAQEVVAAQTQKSQTLNFVEIVTTQKTPIDPYFLFTCTAFFLS